MGAEQFILESRGETAQIAFHKAVDEAAYEYGHGGYTGTIAEKNSFVMIPLPKETNPRDFIQKLFMDKDDRIDDKWGPAGCIHIGEAENGESIYVFFGWASS